MNLVFAGTPEFGLPCLEALLHSAHDIKAIYTQPDRPAGRGRKLHASAVKEWALAHEIPIYQPVNFKNPEAIAELAALKPDVLVVIAYGLILPKAVLDIPKFGCINVHASLLPRWRGASPIQAAILHGDKESGVSIMQMDVGLDTGPVFCTASYSLSESDTAKTLHDHLAQIATKPLVDTLDKLNKGLIKSEAQNDHLATHIGKINKEEALINWQESALAINRKIRAFNPWPIAYTFLNEMPLRVHQAQVITSTQNTSKPGTIIQIDKKGMLVATGDQQLRVEKIQLPGAKIISVSDWLNSQKSQVIAGMSLHE